MNATHRSRLNKLADFLEALPPRKFDIGRWWCNGSLLVTDPEPTCGTVACALGWATTIPAFRRAGLHLRQGTPILLIHGEIAYGLAAGRFFGLTREEAAGVFLAETYRSENPRPKTVARRLRKLAEEHE